MAYFKIDFFTYKYLELFASIYEATLNMTETHTYIYIVSTELNVTKNMIKIGRHKGTQSKLISRYKTALINPIVYLFLRCDDYVAAENSIKKALKKYRIPDDKGTLTEWVSCSIYRAAKTIIRIVKKYNLPTKDNSKKTSGIEATPKTKTPKTKTLKTKTPKTKTLKTKTAKAKTAKTKTAKKLYSDKLGN